MSTLVDKKDEIVMRLVHYFITEENYQPIIVNGVKNEIWLENLNANYKVIRINSNYIHNEEQLKFDNFKIKNVTKQIKKKTLSFKLKTLNILLDLNDNIPLKEDKLIDNYKVDSLKDIRQDDNLAGLFPKLKTMTLKKTDDVENFIKLTNDINEKSEADNKEYERIFKPKRIVITNILVVLNIIMFALTMTIPKLANMFILDPNAVRNGEVYRLLTSTFMHASILHLVFNMYALSIIGKQVETFLGKSKFLLVYLFSGLTGSLLSCAITNSYSLGASGAIFGLMGSLLYFGYHYRLYLGSVLLGQIVPVIVINLVIGYITPSIDNAAHIGGLVGGLFISMALGVNKDDERSSKVNGIITSLILLLFLIYLVFFTK
ncbi:MAG: rhomboid family intramembrane serine protease [Bacilli bacterium]|nr:rhomboid family intramembrane serine protease [Bacilli bacterium]